MDDNEQQQQRIDESSSTGDLRHLFCPTATPMLSATPYLLPPPQQSRFSAATGGAFTPFQYSQPHPPYEMMLIMGGQLPPGQVEFQSGSTRTTLAAEVGSTARWPRQETLTLLEVRSRLDHKFKEANQKAPLWDQVSRIMNEEYGHQRSGKKCREKFENLYKYYKKTRDGKGGRQDGKNYRFFRQLESIYGQQQSASVKTSTANTSHHDYDQEEAEGKFSLSMSSSELQTSSSKDDNPNRAKRRGKRRWKCKIKEFIGLQIEKIMETQEPWLEKVMRVVESKEKERMLRDEEWRNNEFERIEREHRLWAKERAWIEARDRALIDALHSHLYNYGTRVEPDPLDIGIVGGNPMNDRFKYLHGND